MKKGAHHDTQILGIPIDRHVRHTTGLNEKKCLNKSISFRMGTFYCLGNFPVNCERVVPKNFNFKKKRRPFV